MNTTRFTILTNNHDFIELLQAKVPLTKDNDFTYTCYVSVCVEIKLCDYIEECAEKTKACVSVLISCQDPGNGETSFGWITYYNGKPMK